MEKNLAETLQWSVATGVSSPLIAHHLGVDGVAYLDAVARVVVSRDVSNQGIHFEGDWGDGKTHLANMLRGYAKNSDKSFAAVCLLTINGEYNSLNHFEECVFQLIDQIRIDGEPADYWLSNWYTSSPSEVNKVLDTENVSLTHRNWLRKALTEGLQSHHWLQAMGLTYRGGDSSRRTMAQARRLFVLWARLYQVRTGAPVMLVLDEAENIRLEPVTFSRRRCYETLEYFWQASSVLPIMLSPARLLKLIEDDNNGVEMRYLVDNQRWPLYDEFVEHLPKWQHIVISPPTLDSKIACILLHRLGLIHQRQLTTTECVKLHSQLHKSGFTDNTRNYLQAAQRYLMEQK